MLTFVNHVLQYLGLRVSKIIKSRDRLLTNVFKRNYSKRVLLSYITAPFTQGISNSHTNYTECYTAAQIFDELGYQVDVANYYDEDLEINFENYQVVYGQGCPLEKSFYFFGTENLVKIFYSTGCNPFYSYEVSAVKAYDFFLKKGKLIPESLRISSFFWTYQYLCPDHMIVLGNKFVTDTYLSSNPRLKCSNLDCFYITSEVDVERKDFEKAKQNYLWFGSRGLLHKGLDVALDAFLDKQDINLHICGASRSEKKFFDFYDSKISQVSNIYDHGFVDIKSDAFKVLMNTCAFAIFPSVSEGGAPALLTVMANGGLIPICSETVGVDVSDFGIMLDRNDVDALKSALERTQKMSKEEIKDTAITIAKNIRSGYRLEDYRLNLKKILDEVLPK